MTLSLIFQQLGPHRRHLHDAADLVPVPNDVPWYYLTLAILVGAALLSHGITAVASSWESELKLPSWFSVAAQGFSIVLASAMGCLAGYLVWEWALGGMVGLIGAFSSQLVLGLIRARLGAAKETLKEAAGTAGEPAERGK